MVARATPPEPQLRVRQLARESGVSKELIHHYLRAGLLPRPEARALYGAIHLRLLRLVKRLRDERFLPLPVIRDLFAFHGHDPERIELHLLSGAGAAPPAALAPPLGEADRFGADELAAHSGAPHGFADRCVAAGLVRPATGADRLFTPHDANIVSLVARGTAMGIPFDSFRTIRSYVEIAFELERASFLPRTRARPDLGDLAREFAARRDVANGFVANVIAALIDENLHREIGESTAEAGALASAFYRPSDAFLRKHGLLREIERLRGSLGREARRAGRPRVLARLFFLAGRYREAAFAVEQGGAPGAGDPDAARIRGFALVLTGEAARGIETLEAARAARPDDPVAAAYLAAARFHALARATQLERALRGLQDVTQLAEHALERASRAPAADAAEARLCAGWVLVSVPAACEQCPRGVAAIEAAHRAAAPSARPAVRPEAARLRARIAASYLLVRALRRADLDPAVRRRLEPRRAALAAEVVALDPQSDAALDLYLEGKGGPP